MYAVIDIETTGGNLKSGKITEVAIFIHDGISVIDEFVSLVNPECFIPAHITNLTGITNEMVKRAPKFYEIAKKIVEITENMVFVAHNASFDYGFIKEEFSRLGYNYERNTLCTVKFSRKVLPGFPSYSLGEICKHFDISINGRHRAGGDALATTKLLEILFSRDKKNVGKFLISRNRLDQQINEYLHIDQINTIPESTGIYYLSDKAGDVHYVGKSKNIRKRLIQHFLNNSTQKSRQIIEHTAQIDFEVTGSELVALLKESEEIKRLQPKYNSKQLRNSYRYGLFTSMQLDGIVRLEARVVKRGESPITYFSTEEEAKKMLEGLIRKYQLCPSKCGMEQDLSPKPCFHYKLSLCKGVCCHQEEVDAYNERVDIALRKINFENENFMIIEEGRNEEEKAVIKIEKGHFSGVGYVHLDLLEGNIDLLKECIKNYRRNKEVNSIVRGYLSNPGKKSIILY
ncbi:MAG: exonuclease domain-containing protein [Bacteroidota bacterium]